MTKLVLGVLLWSIAHLIPSLFAGPRRKLVERFGENAYKGLFLLLMVLAIYLVVSGWKAAVPGSVYLPPAWGRHVTALLVLVGFVLLFAPYPPNNIRRLGPSGTRAAKERRVAGCRRRGRIPAGRILAPLAVRFFHPLPE